MRRSAIILLICCLAVTAAGWRVWGILHEPAGDPVHSVIRVTRGMTLKPVLLELAHQGVLRHPWITYAYARLTKHAGLQVGYYDMDGTNTPIQMLTMLREGRVKVGMFTLAEGLNRWQVRDKLAEEKWLTRDEFDALCDDADFLAEHGVPGPTCEGYLFPETYTFPLGIEPEHIFAAMFRLFKTTLAKVVEEHGRGPLAWDDQKLMTLAAVVEKETGAPEERPRIACVFYNRLKAKPAWRLETDPTVIYAATLSEPDFNGNITRRHLREMNHPYNTYYVFGLPPGPIANPGRAAMTAVVTPDTCADFFFVSMNNGTHAFCPNLKCHLAAVSRWQQRARAQKQSD